MLSVSNEPLSLPQKVLRNINPGRSKKKKTIVASMVLDITETKIKSLVMCYNESGPDFSKFLIKVELLS